MKTAIEIVNVYRSHVDIEKIKSKISHTYVYENKDLYRKVFNQDPPIEIIPDYYEAEYIKTCRIERIKTFS